MPYIRQARREILETHITGLAQALAGCLPGDLNYCITRLIDSQIDSPSYHNYRSIIGDLECVKLELYRRCAAVYEDRKAHEAGDVYDHLPEGDKR